MDKIIYNNKKCKLEIYFKSVAMISRQMAGLKQGTFCSVTLGLRGACSLNEIY